MTKAHACDVNRMQAHSLPPLLMTHAGSYSGTAPSLARLQHASWDRCLKHTHISHETQTHKHRRTNTPLLRPSNLFWNWTFQTARRPTSNTPAPMVWRVGMNITILFFYTRTIYLWLFIMYLKEQVGVRGRLAQGRFNSGWLRTLGFEPRTFQRGFKNINRN